MKRHTARPVHRRFRYAGAAALMRGPGRAVAGLIALLVLVLVYSPAAAVDRPEASVRWAPETIHAHADALFRDPRAPIGGNPQGDVTLVMFFDYNCGCCRGVARELAAVEHDDPGLRIIYLELPILGAPSVLTARAALAARHQDAYVEFHEALMASRGYTDLAGIMATAADLLLDAEQMRTDMDDPTLIEAIEHNLALARALDILGTPAFVIGDRLVQGAMPRERIAAVIAAERDASGP